MVEERLACSEGYRHKHQVDFPEATITVAGSGGAQALHTVASGKKCRVMELSITHEGTKETEIQLVTDSTVKLTILCPPQSSRVWSSQPGRKFTESQVIKIQSSNIDGGNTIVSGSGVEN